MAKVILLIKRESDTIIKQLKLQGKELYRKQFVDIEVTKEELMLDLVSV